jgi:hypothetical protein
MSKSSSQVAAAILNIAHEKEAELEAKLPAHNSNMDDSSLRVLNQLIHQF